MPSAENAGFLHGVVSVNGLSYLEGINWYTSLRILPVIYHTLNQLRGEISCEVFPRSVIIFEIYCSRDLMQEIFCHISPDYVSMLPGMQ